MSGRLPENLVHFGRLLRDSGMPVGPDRTLEAVRAASRIGLEAREDLRAALAAVFVSRPEHAALFDLAFERFFRERGGLEDALSTLLPKVGAARPERAAATRVGLALARNPGPSAPRPDRPGEAAVASWSDRESLRRRDFDQMTPDEMRAAAHWIARLELPHLARRSRRTRPAEHGPRFDARASLRASLRSAGADLPVRWRAPRTRPAPWVLLCDVSGSMSRYARVLLHFAHALGASQPGVHVFVFGTRLTNVTRCLRGRDADAALAAVGRVVEDWSGGTRIGSALHAFNRTWSRRVLAAGTTVLLVTDGLDREDGRGVAAEAERLRRACRRLVWLNPLLRYPGFEPLAAGIRALLPHVDEHRPVHDLASLEDLVQALAGAAMQRRSA